MLHNEVAGSLKFKKMRNSKMLKKGYRQRPITSHPSHPLPHCTPGASSIELCSAYIFCKPKFPRSSLLLFSFVCLTELSIRLSIHFFHFFSQELLNVLKDTILHLFHVRHIQSHPSVIVSLSRVHKSSFYVSDE